MKTIIVIHPYSKKRIEMSEHAYRRLVQKIADWQRAIENAIETYGRTEPIDATANKT